MSTSPDLSAASDQEVIDQARQHSEDAYRELMRRFIHPILQTIYNVVRNRALAEDLTQDTFVKVFHALEHHAPKRNPKAWARRIAYNTAIDYINTRDDDSLRSHLVVTPSRIDRMAHHVSTTGDTPTPRPQRRRYAGNLDRAVQQLRSVHRRCFLLRHVEERSYDDIADIMNLPVGTVKSHLHRARRQLKRTLTALADPVSAQGPSA